MMFNTCFKVLHESRVSFSEINLPQLHLTYLINPPPIKNPHTISACSLQESHSSLIPID
jgi:hypothetical protein